MRLKKYLIQSICCFLMLFVFIMNARTANAETRQGTIAYLEEQQDLTVMFMFENQVEPITFLSPSGERVDEHTEGVLYESDQKWATYKIPSAEPGEWKVEYELSANSYIDFSLVDENLGVWLQYVNVTGMNEQEVTLKFIAESDEGDIYYYYKISAISNSAEQEPVEVYRSGAYANQEQEVSFYVNKLPSGSYAFQVDLWYEDGQVELFDTMKSDYVDYVNPNAMEPIEDFYVYVDSFHGDCLIDWNEFAQWGYEGYRLTVLADQEVIYKADFENDVTKMSVLISEGTSTLQIKLSYLSGGVVAEAREKTIDLKNEFVNLTSLDVTGSGQAVIEYKVNKDRVLNAVINDENANFKLTGDGTLSFQLSEGGNVVSFIVEGDDRVIYKIDQASIYYDALPPSISLYENLDGKTFYASEANIIGKVSDGDVFYLNKEPFELNGNGEFAVKYPLTDGENIIVMEAVDVNGNSAKMTLTLYKGSKSDVKITPTEKKNEQFKYLPLIISGIASVVIIILSLIFMKKKEKKGKFSVPVWPFVLFDLAAIGGTVYAFMERSKLHKFVNSMEFFELAEKTASEAVEYMEKEEQLIRYSNRGLIVSIVGVVITVLLIVVKILLKKLKDKKAKEPEKK